ncbi:hypothetical protein O181_015225 [Austropuccinia psidii MF-1]|uniref:Uncharacterized protein n=1 Tax=Austropuccinia psidii MF-1 TaxID=1389203 RepID=A0A9Q3GQQ4_9BASI|nr:hypothetical protein [Austropuccinia psidii MF-1]
MPRSRPASGHIIAPFSSQLAIRPGLPVAFPKSGLSITDSSHYEHNPVAPEIPGVPITLYQFQKQNPLLTGITLFFLWTCFFSDLKSLTNDGVNFQNTQTKLTVIKQGKKG